MKYAKPPLTHEEQLEQLEQRGLRLSNRSEALHYLKHLNYFRLAAYWLPFEADHESHSFSPGTQFIDVLNLYVFDRELRLLVLDAIERVEVSIRTNWAYSLAHRYGPHAHLDPNLYKTPNKRWNHSDQISKLEEDAQKSHEIFSRHYRSKYDEPLPPIWVCVELMTLGQLSKWYSGLLKTSDRNAVAHEYDLDETNLTSFLHHLSTVRNICAHHSRLWNREFTFTFKLPKKRPTELALSLNPSDERRVYNTLTVLAWLMDRTSREHHWKQRLINLIFHHSIKLNLMGFPSDWHRLPLWKDLDLPTSS
jgi:abortive infection bacteriophage resistance protein